MVREVDLEGAAEVGGVLTGARAPRPGRAAL